MNIVIIATRTCSHRPILERELQAMGLSFTVEYVEDHPELAQKFAIQNSPNLVLDDKIVFRGAPEKKLPTREELKELLGLT
jgi:glutaredoxin